MKPDTRTVTELFERDVRYVVPLYQRPYVWNEKDQWEPLWEDVQVLLQHQRSPHDALGQGWSHFLGAIVLDQETQAPGSIPLYTVIDGQQRLTTLQLLLAAAAKVAFEVGADVDGQILRGLIMNNPLKAQGEQAFKVWPTNANRVSFMGVVREEGPTSTHKNDPLNLIDEAFSYFVGRIVEWISDEPEDERTFLMRILRVTLCDLLKMVSITLEADDNAQVIFETLNARGTPLLALDLVKNAALHEASRQSSDVDALYHEVWKPQLDDDYWREMRRQGRLYRPRADLFLMHWLTMKLRRVVPSTELFALFRKDVLQHPTAPKASELVEELCRDAATMRGFESQPAGSVEQRFFHHLVQLDISTFYPLSLYLFRSQEISLESRRRALRIIESWLVRRALMRFSTKSYSETVPPLIQKIAVDPEKADQILLQEFRSGTSAIEKWPGDADLMHFFQNFDAYGNVARSRLVLALAAVERSLYSSKVEIPEVPTRLSLEHVMPQKWQLNWGLPAGLSIDQEAEATERRQRAIHKLGNLTLTTSPLNSELSNDAWPVKQQALNKHSKLLLNARLIESYRDEFDESSIDARTEEIVRAICRIWPGPEADWATI